jgi:hypothetical protein
MRWIPRISLRCWKVDSVETFEQRNVEESQCSQLGVETFLFVWIYRVWKVETYSASNGQKTSSQTH